LNHFDLAVIGGSFAGLSCAIEAQKNGLKTIVFDKKKSSSAYTQSTGLFVKEIAEQITLPANLIRKIEKVKLYSPNMTALELKAPQYYFIATDTCNVLGHFAQMAIENGVTIVQGENVEAIKQSKSGIQLPQQSVTCDYLVGADGAKSKVASLCGLGQNQEFLSGVEYEVTGFNNLDQNSLQVFLDQKLAPGYIGWLVPGVHYTQVGLAVKHPNKPNIKSFIEKISNHFDVKDIKIITKRGGLIPCGGVVKPYAKQNICLLGDAAGAVSPLTAGGIHPAIEIGKLLGKAINDYLQNQALPPHEAIKKHMPTYTTKKQLRRIFDWFNPSNKFFDIVIGNALFKKIAQTVFFHHRGLLSAAAWKDILKMKSTKPKATS